MRDRESHARRILLRNERSRKSGRRLPRRVDDLATAVRTGGCKRVDRAFEAVEGVAFARHRYLEAFVVVVSADITFGHGFPPP